VIARGDSIRALVERWRDRVSELRPFSPAAASAFSLAAQELERAVGDEAAITVDLAEASAESGYSRKYLSDLIAGGKLPNRGKKYEPRIALGDLPRKPGYHRPSAKDAMGPALSLHSRR